MRRRCYFDTPEGICAIKEVVKLLADFSLLFLGHLYVT